MTMLQFKGEPVQIRVTFNVLSEMTRLTEKPFSEVINLSSHDPMGFVRDVVYCSLRIYHPEKVGEMNNYQVGDLIYEDMDAEELSEFIKQLMEDFVQTAGLKKVASEKK